LLETLHEKRAESATELDDALDEGLTDCLTFALKMGAVVELCDVPEPPPEKVCTGLGIWALLDMQKCFCVISTLLLVGEPEDCF